MTIFSRVVKYAVLTNNLIRILHFLPVDLITRSEQRYTIYTQKSKTQFFNDPLQRYIDHFYNLQIYQDYINFIDKKRFQNLFKSRRKYCSWIDSSITIKEWHKVFIGLYSDKFIWQFTIISRAVKFQELSPPESCLGKHFKLISSLMRLKVLRL